MDIKDLKDGMVVELRNGRRYMVDGNLGINLKGYIPLHVFSKDMTLENVSQGDIVKVYKKAIRHLSLKELIEPSEKSLIYRREEVHGNKESEKKENEGMKIEKNMETICKMIGVEMGEKFNVSGWINAPYSMENDGLYDASGQIWLAGISLLIAGLVTIEKLPFKPNPCQVAYILDPKRYEGYELVCISDRDIIKMMIARGVIFYRTEEEVQAEVKRLGWA